jgi:polyisoprenoid-binding protein YceI
MFSENNQREIVMIRNIRHAFLLLLVTFTVAFPSYAAEKFTIDPHHSYVHWGIKHMGFSTQSGKWFVTGTISLDKDKPQNSKVDVSIDVDKIVTGIAELDTHLKGNMFFDVAQFPKATFVSDKVDVLNDTSAKVHGMLTLHGVTKPVTLNVTLNKVGVNPINGQMTAGFTADTEIKRSDFGIKAYLPGLSDEVPISINVEANQPKK